MGKAMGSTRLARASPTIPPRSPSTLSATPLPTRDDRILFNLMAGMCRRLRADHIRRPKWAVHAPDSPDVDVLSMPPGADEAVQQAVLLRYAALLDLYTTAGLSPMVPVLDCTWKDGTTFYISTRRVCDDDRDGKHCVTLDRAAPHMPMAQLMLAMADLCLAVGGSHGLGVAHTHVSPAAVLLAPDLSRMKLTQYGARDHLAPFGFARAADLHELTKTLQTLAVGKFINITEAVELVQAGQCIEAGQLLRCAALASVQGERQGFHAWAREMRSTVFQRWQLSDMPVNTDSFVGVLTDIHLAVAAFVDGQLPAGAVPYFHPRNSPVRGQAAVASIMQDYFQAAVAFGGLVRVPGCEGLWPSTTIFTSPGPGGDEADELATTTRTQFFHALGFALGLCMTMGITVPYHIAPCVVCIALCDDLEYRSVDAMPEAYQSAVVARIGELAALRRGMAVFTPTIRANRWTVQQLYAFFFEATPSGGATLRDCPDAVDIRGFSLEEAFVLRRVLNQLDAAQTRQFMMYATGDPAIHSVHGPVVICRGPPDATHEVVVACSRTITLPASMAITPSNVCTLLAAQLGDNYFNAT